MSWDTSDGSIPVGDEQECNSLVEDNTEIFTRVLPFLKSVWEFLKRDGDVLALLPDEINSYTDVLDLCEAIYEHETVDLEQE